MYECQAIPFVRIQPVYDVKGDKIMNIYCLCINSIPMKNRLYLAPYICMKFQYIWLFGISLDGVENSPKSDDIKLLIHVINTKRS